jgi:hypothetical protein
MDIRTVVLGIIDELQPMVSSFDVEWRTVIISHRSGRIGPLRWETAQGGVSKRDGKE